MLQVGVLEDLLRRQQLHLGVEVGHPVLGQQEQKVQTQELVLQRGFRQEGVVVVVGLQLGHVTLERGQVALCHAPLDPDLEDVACGILRMN